MVKEYDDDAAVLKSNFSNTMLRDQWKLRNTLKYFNQTKHFTSTTNFTSTDHFTLNELFLSLRPISTQQIIAIQGSPRPPSF